MRNSYGEIFTSSECYSIRHSSRRRTPGAGPADEWEDCALRAILAVRPYRVQSRPACAPFCFPWKSTRPATCASRTARERSHGDRGTRRGRPRRTAPDSSQVRSRIISVKSAIGLTRHSSRPAREKERER